MHEQAIPPEESDDLRQSSRVRRTVGLEWLLAGLLLLGLLAGAFVSLKKSRVNAELERAFWVVGHASYPVPERQAAFQRLVAAGNKEWRGAYLAGLNLADTKLPGVDLRDADFTDANWWRARRLTSEQIARLHKSFPPSAAAPPALRQDYEAWLKETAGRD